MQHHVMCSAPSSFVALPGLCVLVALNFGIMSHARGVGDSWQDRTLLPILGSSWRLVLWTDCKGSAVCASHISWPWHPDSDSNPQTVAHTAGWFQVVLGTPAIAWRSAQAINFLLLLVCSLSPFPVCPVLLSHNLLPVPVYNKQMWGQMTCCWFERPGGALNVEVCCVCSRVLCSVWVFK